MKMFPVKSSICHELTGWTFTRIAMLYLPAHKTDMKYENNATSFKDQNGIKQKSELQRNKQYQQYLKINHLILNHIREGASQASTESIYPRFHPALCPAPYPTQAHSSLLENYILNLAETDEVYINLILCSLKLHSLSLLYLKYFFFENTVVQQQTRLC